MGDDEKEGEPQTTGLNFMDKTLIVRDARISYSIWEVGGNSLLPFIGSVVNQTHVRRGPCVSWSFDIGPLVCPIYILSSFFILQYNQTLDNVSMLYFGAGDKKSQDNMQVACMDSVAILFMFDLTSRCTLNRCVSLSLFMLF